jgi:hypothetical protein
MSSRFGSVSLSLVVLAALPCYGQGISEQELQRRIAFADGHFTTAATKGQVHLPSIPGSQTDRGKAYIALGPPEEITDGKCMENTDCMPHQEWTYRTISGVGKNVCISFMDVGLNYTYKMISTPCRTVGGDYAKAQRRYELIRKQIERVLVWERMRCTFFGAMYNSQ